MQNSENRGEQSFSEKIEHMTNEEKARFLVDIWVNFYELEGKTEEHRRLYGDFHFMKTIPNINQPFQEMFVYIGMIDKNISFNELGEKVSLTEEEKNRILKEIEKIIEKIDWVLVEKVEKVIKELKKI